MNWKRELDAEELEAVFWDMRVASYEGETAKGAWAQPHQAALDVGQ